MKSYQIDLETNKEEYVDLSPEEESAHVEEARQRRIRIAAQEEEDAQVRELVADFLTQRRAPKKKGDAIIDPRVDKLEHLIEILLKRSGLDNS